MTLLERADEYARKHSGLGPKDPRYQRYYRAFIAGYEVAKGDARATLLDVIISPRPLGVVSVAMGGGSMQGAE